MAKTNMEKVDWKFNLKLYFGLLSTYKLPFIGILLLILFIEASYVISKYLFKIVVDQGTLFASGTVLKSDFITMLLWIAGVYIVLGILRFLAKFSHIHLIARMDGGLMFDLKKKFFNHIIGLSHEFHTNEKTGGLISKLVRSGSSVERMTDVLVFSVAPLVFSIFLVIGAIGYINILSALAILFTIICFIGYSVFIQKKQEPWNVAANKKEDYEKAMIADYLNNIDSIKYFGKERTIKNKFKKIGLNTKIYLIKKWDFFRWFDGGQAIILTIGFLSVNIFSIIAFINGKQTMGDFVFIYTTFGSLMGPLFSFVHGIRGFYQSMSDFEALFKYAKIENEVKDSPKARNYKIKKGEIIFKGVHFAYGKRKVFKNLNLTISKGQKVALVGHSGCGKSTLIKLLYRMYDVSKGEIIIDNKIINEYTKESLRNEMSIVPQECALFDDTIYNNIAFSRPNAKRKEVLKAIKFAQLDKIINYFPEGHKTIVGERGIKLSGGEKQRVSIARALLADKKVLVLDEATSALDSETEHEIQRDLEKLMKGRTSIIIAHRLSTIMKADLIVVMENGKIIEMATHNELISKGGHYKKLWDLQKGGFNEN